PAEFADKQERIARAYGSMGVRPSFTCTPYLVGARPGFGEHVAWAESNAVCFANSVLGARTNREGGPSALAAAIGGATPDDGLPSITISRRDLVEAQRSFTDGTKPDVIALGSPQLSGQELWGVADRVRRKPPRIPVWVFTSRAVRDENPEPVAAIESHGGRVLADTCLEVTLLEHRFGTVATPSGKAAYYLPSLCKQKVILDELDALLERYG